MIELANVTKVYRKGRVEVPALRGVDLRIAEGEHVALMGPSGAGKSTLLYLMGLMEEPTTGRVTLFGEDVTNLSDTARSRLRGRTIGFVFQAFNLIPQLVAWQNVALPLRYQGVPRRQQKERALAMLERVGLADRSEHYPAELSGGEEQRVAIARALVIEPRLILADEPTGNLDTRTGRAVLGLLESAVADGPTLLIVTHDQEVAARAGRVVRVVDGQVLDGSPSGPPK
ncbi:ABC transporter ATP-binding protein [Oceanithermus desulfurans]|uniref:ABC transporter ATP-binding protein n=2 Tax=Oceanithermus desulfurans TaxID=227924 RepID=A0A511RHJ3_9DEIN|nr:ABC transporter ATP-binding protein [Oceanithermus desulfurans]MBB6030905.1 putative ABC transport system ATP-binding protein [Oceanithermus desulfurans]GEM88577.1 ABC transporter ATP-binding protein [Oceanithermus desulfurans NBRC 100063]